MIPRGYYVININYLNLYLCFAIFYIVELRMFCLSFCFFFINFTLPTYSLSVAFSSVCGNYWQTIKT